MKALIEFILNRSWPVILGFIVVTALVMSGATRIKLDSSTTAFQPDHHPILTINDEIKRTFGSSENLIGVLGGNIYTAPTLNELRALTTALEGVSGVERVTSLANFSRLTEEDGFIRTTGLVGKNNLSSAEIAAIRTYLEAESSSLVSRDGKNTVIVVQMKEGVNQQKFGADITQAVNAGWKSGEISLSGAAFIAAEVNRTIVNDLQVVGGLALVLIMVFLFLNFGSVHGVVLTLVQVFFGMNIGLGLYGWTGAPAGALTTIGIIAILAVGSSFSLHLLGRFYSELSHGKTKVDALRAMYTQTAPGVIISALAIVVAMMTLWLSDIGTLRDVGTLIVLGVLGSLLSALFLVPALVNVLPQPKVKVQPTRTGIISVFLKGLAHFVFRHRTPMFVGAGVLVVFGLIGVMQIQPNTSFLAFFPKDSSTVKSINRVDRVFGGSASIQLLLEGDILEPKVLNTLQTFKTRAKAEIPGIGNTVSIADTVLTLNSLFDGKREIPSSREKVLQELLIYQSGSNTAQMTQQLSLSQRQTLVSISIPLGDTQETRAFYNAVQTLANDVFRDVAQVKVGGNSLNVLALEDALIHDFIISLSLAIVLVIIVDSFVRSFRAAVITISSLLMTIILQYGLLGWLGIDLDISTMLLGALAIGVGDYAIHLTVRFLEERRLGNTPEIALEHTLVTSGRSILFTALTLGAGFAALSVSQLQPVASLGQMMVFTVLAVGVSSLSLLPAMCLQFLSEPTKKRALRSSAAD